MKSRYKTCRYCDNLNNVINVYCHLCGKPFAPVYCDVCGTATDTIKLEHLDARVSSLERKRVNDGPSFESIVNDALKLNQRLRLNSPDIRRSISMSAWLRDFCTIKIDIGHGVGKTTYINKYATSDDLVIAKSRQQAMRYVFTKGTAVYTTQTCEQILNYSIRGCKFSNVYLDEVSDFYDELVDELHGSLGYGSTIFVFGD